MLIVHLDLLFIFIFTYLSTISFLFFSIIKAIIPFFFTIIVF